MKEKQTVDVDFSEILEMWKEIEKVYIVSAELYSGKCELTLTDLWNELIKHSILYKENKKC